MPEFTGLWIYLGSFSGIPTSTTSYPTTAQAESLEGFVSSAFQNPPYPSDNSDLRTAEVTWTVDNSNRAIVNNATGQTSVGTYDLGSGPVSSPMNYTANYRVEIILADGTVIADGMSIVQYTNGDMFVRPSSTLGTDILQLPSAISGIRIVDHVPTSGGQTGFAAFVGPRTFEGAEGETPPIVCFARGTLILTAEGDLPVEDLAAGMLVATSDDGMQPIHWIGRRRLARAHLLAHPQLRPVRIRAGALGQGLPIRDLVVSPQHRVIVRSDIARRMTGNREILVAAKHLVGSPGIEIDEAADGVEYWHFLFDRHQIVRANGAEAESLFTGPMALLAVDEDARAEILAIMPELSELDHDRTPEPARALISGRHARRLAARHMKNARAYVT